MEKNNYKCWKNGLINIFTDFYLTHTPLEVNYIIFTQALTSPKSPSREHFSSFLSVAKAESPVILLAHLYLTTTKADAAVRPIPNTPAFLSSRASESGKQGARVVRPS